MATSGSYLTSQVVNAYTGDGCPDRANISWSATWDASSMLWTINWSANGAGYYNNNYVTIFSGTVTITDGNGNTLQTKSMSGQIPYARKDVQLVSGSFSVGVNTYGDRNIAFSATFRIGVNGSSGESTGSQTFALDNIPLASTISSVTQNVSVGSSGGVATVNIVRNNASYTHRVVWAFGSNSYTQTGQGTTESYTIPASWLAAIPNSASGSASVTVTTFNGSTQIGQSVSATFTVSAAVNPSIGGFSVAPRGTAYNAGITTAYIAGYSTALLSASSAAGVNGSSIAKYEFINGSTVIASYNSSASSYSHTTGTLTGSSASFSVRVTDTRGRTATKAASAITIKAYATPSFSTANAYRCNSGGTAQNDGTYVKVEATAVATPTENSIVSLTFAEKATTSSTWSAEISIADYPITSGFANTTSYDVRIKATDKLGQSSYRYFTIPTAEYTMDFKVGGKGVAFGKVAETDYLVESEWDIKAPFFRGNRAFTRELTSADDLNNIKDFGWYYEPSAGATYMPANVPSGLTSAFTLEVLPSNGIYANSGAWVYLTQRLKPYNSIRYYERMVYTNASGTWVYGAWEELPAQTENITVTAGTNVSINPSATKVVRNGKIVSGYIRFTASNQISAYAYVINGLPAFATSAVFTLLNEYNGQYTSPVLYTDTGNAGLRVGAANMAAGTYNVSFTYICQ